MRTFHIYYLTDDESKMKKETGLHMTGRRVTQLLSFGYEITGVIDSENDQ